MPKSREEKLRNLKDDYTRGIAEKCLKKFSDEKHDYQGFRRFLCEYSPIPLTPEKIDEVVKSADLSRFIEILAPLKIVDLMEINGGEKFGIILDPEMLKELQESIKYFYKVTFTEDLTPVITPLDSDGIWGGAGLDKDSPFIVINPMNGSANARDLAISSEKENLKNIAFEAKIFEKGVRKYVSSGEERQYLVAVSETSGKPNFDLITEHNSDPSGFTTAYTTNQARLIYGPLIADGSGLPLPDEEIVKNLSKARSYNPSLGTVTANCQNNALVEMMRGLGISEEIIKEGIENMRRIDGPNMAAVNPGISPSTVIIEGSNDALAERFIGGRKPSLPDSHTHTSVVPVDDRDDHRIKVYLRLPEEVYHPAKKPTSEEKKQEDKIVRDFPRFSEKRFLRNLPDSEEDIKEIKDDAPKVGIQARLAGMAARLLAKKEQKDILQDLSLEGLRYRDKNVHNAPHLTMPATPGNEVAGGDPDLLYKLMADMLTREDSRDVSNYFKQVSYVITPPDYDAFKADIERLAEGDKNVIYDDVARSVKFIGDDRDIFLKYKSQLSGEEYPFFVCHPENYDPAICKRYEGNVEKPFALARAESDAWYDKLSTEYEAPEVELDDLTGPETIVIAETHSDIASKSSVIELLEKPCEPKTVLCLENFSKSLNSMAKAWLEGADSAMPEILREKLLSLGEEYSKQISEEEPATSAEYLEELRQSYVNILVAAKKNGAEVRFIESDLTANDLEEDSVKSRHAGLCKNLSEIKSQNPDARIIVLAGEKHEERSAEQPITLSDVVRGVSCKVVQRDLPLEKERPGRSPSPQTAVELSGKIEQSL